MKNTLNRLWERGIMMRRKEDKDGLLIIAVGLATLTFIMLGYPLLKWIVMDLWL